MLFNKQCMVRHKCVNFFTFTNDTNMSKGSNKSLKLQISYLFMFSHSSFPLPHISVVLCIYTNLYCFHTYKLHVPIDEYTTCTRHSLNKLVVRYLHGFTMHINVYAMQCIFNIFHVVVEGVCAKF